METAPVVSIVICTRNRAKTLQATIAALMRIESSHPWEAILVDNASTDGTMQALQAFGNHGGRFRCLRVERIGLGAARDAAWRQARGRIVSFTDDDCYVAPDYVDQIVEVFRRHPEVGCVGGRILLHDPTDAPITIEERDVPRELRPFHFVEAGELHGANLSFRFEALERAGGFDPELGAGTPFPFEDIDVVAATSWAGVPARFDPLPVVSHHHGRKPADTGRIMAGHDRGRGAYYAKYILRKDTRKAYVIGWWRLANAFYYASTLGRLLRECRSAAAYFLHRKRYGFLLVALPVWAAAYAGITVMVGLRFLASRLRRPRMAA